MRSLLQFEPLLHGVESECCPEVYRRHLEFNIGRARTAGSTSRTQHPVPPGGTWHSQISLWHPGPAALMQSDRMMLTAAGDIVGNY